MYLRALAHVANRIIDRSLILPPLCCDLEKVDYDQSKSVLFFACC